MSRKMITAFSLLLISTIRGSEAPTDGDRNLAASWASEYRQEAFDALMPRATDGAVRMPVCRVTTLRVSGSLDTFEYALRLEEPCPSVDVHGALTHGNPTGEFLIAEGSPITDQMARLRLHSPTITPEAAIRGIRIRRYQLAAREVRKVIVDLSASPISPMPPTDISLDTPTYEVASATGITKRLIGVTRASSGRGERRMMKLAVEVAAAHGFDSNRLRYDALFWD